MGQRPAAVVGLFAALAAGPAFAQAGRDLTGVWTNTTITPLERPRNQPTLVVNADEAQRIASTNPLVRRSEEDARPSDLSKDILADRNAGAGYNAGWMDWGSQLSRVKGEYRTSWIVEPADGRLPETEAAQAAQRRASGRQRDTRGPEAMAPNDRCLIASRGSGGPGMLNNIYNNTYQIVQAKDHVVIVVEMVHDARIVPILASKAAAQAAHRPADIPVWLGDSVGWWESNQLVVESVNIHPEQGGYGPIYLSPKGRVTERFERVSPTEIYYAFEVEDPVFYSRSWKAETTLRANEGGIYEYACHEGNYAMEGMLSGARGEERAASNATAVRP